MQTMEKHRRGWENAAKTIMKQNQVYERTRQPECQWKKRTRMKETQGNNVKRATGQMIVIDDVYDKFSVVCT